MALPPIIEQNLSVFISSQFPNHYLDDGEVFVEFVREYYRWMETEGPLKDSRQHLQNLDIDTVVEDFLVHFKQTYLQNIQLETTSNIRLMVKHSLDLYRSRGTPRAIDLLFRLVFGTGADVYYPSRDLFRLSDGKWVIPTYLEVSPREDLDKFVGRQVTGNESQSFAFVERVVRRRIPGGKFVDLLHVSARQGDFVTGEHINLTAEPLTIDECPTIIGSLTDLIVLDGSSDFSVGDEVSLSGSIGGYLGKALVSEIVDQNGQVTWELDSGGYGYTVNSELLISEKVLQVNCVPGASAGAQREYFLLFDQIIQPMAIINYVNATGAFANNDEIFSYHANNLQKGSALVLGVTESNSTAGVLTLGVVTGNLNVNAIYTTANAVSANLDVSTPSLSDWKIPGASMSGRPSPRGMPPVLSPRWTSATIPSLSPIVSGCSIPPARSSVSRAPLSGMPTRWCSASA
jgi:hypothetical protein